MPVLVHLPSPAAPPRRSFDEYDFPVAHTTLPPLPTYAKRATYVSPAHGRARGPSCASTASCASSNTASSSSASSSTLPTTPPRSHAVLSSPVRAHAYRPYWERASFDPLVDNEDDRVDDAVYTCASPRAHVIPEADDDDDEMDEEECTPGFGGYGYGSYTAPSPLGRAKRRSARRSRSPFADDDPLAPRLYIDEHPTTTSYGYGPQYQNGYSPRRVSAHLYDSSPRSISLSLSPRVQAQPSVHAQSLDHSCEDASPLDASPLRTALLLGVDADSDRDSPLTVSDEGSLSPRRYSGRGLGLGLGLGGLALKRRKADWTEYEGDDALNHNYVCSPAADDKNKRRRTRGSSIDADRTYAAAGAIDLSSPFSTARFADAALEHDLSSPRLRESEQEMEECECEDEEVPRCLRLRLPWTSEAGTRGCMTLRARWAALKLRVRLGAFRARRRVGLA